MGEILAAPSLVEPCGLAKVQMENKSFGFEDSNCTMVVSIDSQNLLFSFDWHHRLIFWCQIGTLALRIGKGSNGKVKLLISRFHPCQLFQLELTRLKSAVWRVGPRIMIFVPRLKWRTTAFDCKISWLQHLAQNISR